MSFIWSSLLYLLILVPVLVWLYVRSQRQRSAIASRYGSLGVVQAPGKKVGRWRHIPALFFLLGITVLITSAARPQATVMVPKLEGTVILTFDVSGSMAATDLQPSRMEAAKAAAREFVERQPSNVVIGVVAFSDGGISVQAPTDNREETYATIERLVPRRSTSIGNGILVAINTIVVDAGDPPILKTNPGETSELAEPVEPVEAPQGWYPSAFVILFTDGENTAPPDPLEAAALAADMGVRVYTVGIGTTQGTTIESEGFTFQTMLDETTLSAIAEMTGSAYYSAANDADLARISRDLQPKLSIKPEDIEITSLFAGAGILLFLAAGALSLLWFGRVP